MSLFPEVDGPWLLDWQHLFTEQGDLCQNERWPDYGLGGRCSLLIVRKRLPLCDSLGGATGLFVNICETLWESFRTHCRFCLSLVKAGWCIFNVRGCLYLMKHTFVVFGISWESQNEGLASLFAMFVCFCASSQFCAGQVHFEAFDSASWQHRSLCILQLSARAHAFRNRSRVHRQC